MSWLRLLPYGLTALISLGGAYYLHSWDVDRLTHKHELALSAAETAAAQRCAAAQRITTEVSNDLQTRLAVLNNRLADAQRLRRADCIAVHPAAAAGGHDAATDDHGLPAPHGVTAGALIDFAGDAERVGLQLDACQSFIRQSYLFRGQ